MLKIIAKRLSGPLYGNMCSLELAKKLIKATSVDNSTIQKLINET